MSSPVTLNSEPFKRADTSPPLTVEFDRPMRTPVVIFFASALGWLLLASLLLLVATAQQYAPHAWWTGGKVPWLTFGRTYPAALNLLVYGWCSMAGIGAAVWILGRLTASVERAGSLPIYAGLIWDIGLFCGLLSILSGGGRGRQLLDINPYAGFSIFLALAIMSLWVLRLHRRRRSTYVAHWYIVAAFFWFAWAYLTANLLLNVLQTSGTGQAAIQWWYVNVVRDLWMTPLALGIAFYFLPKLVGRPLHSYRLALNSFWGLAILGGWTGMTNILAGPLPAWMMTAGIVATVLMVLPIAAVAANFHYTLGDQFEALSSNLVLRFIVIGTMIYTATGVWEAITAFRTINRITEFTMMGSLPMLLTIFGFVGLTLFGAIYYIVPRLLLRKWLSVEAIRLHFWITVVGLGLLAVSTFMGGVIQGFGLNDAKIEFNAVTDLAGPFYLFRFVAVLVLLVANMIAAWSFLIILLGPPIPLVEPVSREPESSEPAPEPLSQEVGVA